MNNRAILLTRPVSVVTFPAGQSGTVLGMAMRRTISGLAAGALVAVGILVATANPAAAAPTATMTITPSTVRDGRPVTLTVTVSDATAEYLPATVRFADQDSKVWSDDVPLGADFRARLTVQPRFSGYRFYLFPNAPFSTIYGPTVPVEVIAGYTVSLSFSTVPAQASPGDDVVVQVTAGFGGSIEASTEGGSPMPTGVVSVLANGTALGTGTLNGFGRADIPIVLPNGPLSIGYAGDDLFVDSASSPRFVRTALATELPATGRRLTGPDPVRGCARRDRALAPTSTVPAPDDPEDRGPRRPGPRRRRQR